MSDDDRATSTTPRIAPVISRVVVATPCTAPGLGAALGATILFSLNGTLSTLVYNAGGDPLSMSFWRSLLGGLLVLGALLLLRVLRDRVRLETAQAALRSTATIAEAASQSGFDDPNYFSRWFRRQTGRTPGAWRR